MKIFPILSIALAFIQGTFAKEKPNILVILADDLGYGDVGFNGCKDIQTPQLDALAKNGIIFKNGYVTHAYCGPCRAGLITGRYQARFGLEINLTNSFFDRHSGLPETEKTFATRLKTAGYRTGIVGKWHLGGSHPFHPNNRGFDYFYGFLSGGHCYFPDRVTTLTPLVIEKTGENHYSANEGGYLPLSRNDNTAEFNEYLTTALSRDAAKFVKESEKPFCLYLAYNAPHTPLEAPKKTIAKYNHIKNKKRRVYAAMIDEMDRGIGMVVSALKESGKFDNTLIFFLSDNGAAAWKKEGDDKFDSSGPFRDGKGSMREGGSHVPFILHWPKGIEKSGEFEGLVSALDITATAVAVADADTSGPALDGKNLIPFLNGEKKGSPHKALFWRENNGDGGWAVRTPEAKFLKTGYNGGLEFYDMINDPYESKNIIAESKEQRANLAKLWNDWNAKNKANIFLQSDAYQQERRKMYEELYKKLLERAEKKKRIVIQ